MEYKYTEYYKCDDCGELWAHEWDGDPNNDYTHCPNLDEGCDDFCFTEITKSEFEGRS